jgi:hypothetical protein
MVGSGLGAYLYHLLLHAVAQLGQGTKAQPQIVSYFVQLHASGQCKPGRFATKF